MPKFVLLALVITASWAADAKVQYAGGTIGGLKPGVHGTIGVAGDRELAYDTGKGDIVIVAYDRINLLEYGQQVNRRLVMAVVISPAFLLAKSRKHFLTIGYQDGDGKQQAMVFRVDKNGIRATLVSLEARTGLKIQYQDEEARKAGKG